MAALRVNVMFCIDPVRKVWEGWRRDFGLRGFSFDPQASDWGVAGLNLPSCVAEVRARIGVKTVETGQINGNNRLFEEGCRAGHPRKSSI